MLECSNLKKKIRVGLIIDEFFGAAGTAYGGYGFLARKYIAKYLPNENIEIEVLLGKAHRKYRGKYFSEEHKVDNVILYRLPRNKYAAQLWLKKKKYDIYLSIELTDSYVLENELDINKKLILWIQDPRPLYEWDEINTVQLFPEKSYYNQTVYNLVNNWYYKNKIKFVSQGYFLNKKAIDLYNLDANVNIQYLPNPIDIDYEFDLKNHKKKNIVIFLGRIESVKRGWLFCEIAKQMPQYEFYVIGQTFREKEENSAIMQNYKNISNLFFVGHLEDEKKEIFLKDAKILVNTSIHEALPVSFLEALSYGTVLVSNRNPENLTSQFGIYVGNVIGDGFDKVDLFVNAIQELICDDVKRNILAQAAIDYIKERHSVEKFLCDMRDVIFNTVDNV